MHHAGRLLVLLAIFCIGVCHAEERTFDRQVAAPPGGRLIVQLDIGSAVVTGSTRREVTIQAQMSGSSDSLARITIDVQQNGQGVRVDEHYPRMSGWLGGQSPKVRFIIAVPQDYPVDIRTSGGALELSGLHASVKGDTAGGSIILRDVLGGTEVHTQGGPITAEHLQGRARLYTSGGSIRVRDAQGDIEARTMGGSIDLDAVNGRLDAQTNGGGVSAHQLGDHDISLETNGGSIHLRIPPTVHATLDARTMGGSVHTNIPVTITSAGRSHVQGTINGTTHTIRLHTMGGSIQVEPTA